MKWSDLVETPRLLLELVLGLPEIHLLEGQTLFLKLVYLHFILDLVKLRVVCVLLLHLLSCPKLAKLVFGLLKESLFAFGQKFWFDFFNLFLAKHLDKGIHLRLVLHIL